jgi:Tol biopolymer transport system component
MAQGFDSQRLELSGERAVIVPEVRYQRWGQARFSVSSNGVLLYQSGRAENHQLAWFNRQGKVLSAAGPRNDHLSFNLSPDQRYVTLHRHDDPDTVLPTIWVMDLSREGAVFRITDTNVALPEFNADWAPDSSEILFSRGDDRRMRLFRQALSGGTARCVLDSEGPKFPNDWSSDGQFIAYSSQVPEYRHLHTWIVALGSQEEAKPRLFLQHSCNEFSAQFSPAAGDERWIAYTSNETGRHEVYVRDFPDGRHKWQVSNHGGLQPHWRGDGRELFYLALHGMMMSVTLNPGPPIQLGVPEQLFMTALRFLGRNRVWMNQYAVSRDGQQFLLNCPLPETAQSAITAVIPW